MPHATYRAALCESWQLDSCKCERNPCSRTFHRPLRSRKRMSSVDDVAAYSVSNVHRRQPMEHYFINIYSTCDAKQCDFIFVFEWILIDNFLWLWFLCHVLCALATKISSHRELRAQVDTYVRTIACQLQNVPLFGILNESHAVLFGAILCIRINATATTMAINAQIWFMRW